MSELRPLSTIEIVVLVECYEGMCLMDICTALDVYYFSASMTPTNHHEQIDEVKRLIKSLLSQELIQPVGLDSTPDKQQVWELTIKGLWLVMNKYDFEFIRSQHSIKLWKDANYIRTDNDSIEDDDGYYELCAVSYANARAYVRKLRAERMGRYEA